MFIFLSVSGDIVINRSLNHSIAQSYSLSVMVYDGTSSSTDTLNDTASVVIAVHSMNAFAPEFLAGSRMETHVLEKETIPMILKVRNRKQE